MPKEDFLIERAELLEELESIRALLATMERRMSGWPALWQRLSEQRHAAVWETHARPVDDTSERVYGAAHRTKRLEQRRQNPR